MLECLKTFSGRLISYIASVQVKSLVSYKNDNIWNYFKKHLIKIYTNTHQIASFFKKFSEDLLNPVMYAHLSLLEKKYDTKTSTFPNF